jgi:UDP-N-acetylglucosamine 1-carboxyvinyltransferase
MEFAKLGANVSLVDQHRLYVDGPSELKAAEVVAPPALRPAAVLVVAMLAASGKSILRNVYGVERGYEDLSGRLSRLGAIIKRID